jgi:hypothetical protein
MTELARRPARRGPPRDGELPVGGSREGREVSALMGLAIVLRLPGSLHSLGAQGSSSLSPLLDRGGPFGRW